MIKGLYEAQLPVGLPTEEKVHVSEWKTSSSIINT